MQDLNLPSGLPQAGLFCPLGPNRCLSTSPGACRAGHTEAPNCSLISRYLTDGPQHNYAQKAFLRARHCATHCTGIMSFHSHQPHKAGSTAPMCKRRKQAWRSLRCPPCWGGSQGHSNLSPTLQSHYEP